MLTESNVTKTAILSPIPENIGKPAILCAIPVVNALVMAPPYPEAAAQKIIPTAVSESNPIVRQHASTSGTNAKNSSKFAQNAEPIPKTIMQTGIISNSFPFMALTTFVIPALIAPVPSRIANIAPIISKKKIIAEPLCIPNVTEINKLKGVIGLLSTG